MLPNQGVAQFTFHRFGSNAHGLDHFFPVRLPVQHFQIKGLLVKSCRYHCLRKDRMAPTPSLLAAARTKGASAATVTAPTGRSAMLTSAFSTSSAFGGDGVATASLGISWEAGIGLIDGLTDPECNRARRPATPCLTASVLDGVAAIFAPSAIMRRDLPEIGGDDETAPRGCTLDGPGTTEGCEVTGGRSWRDDARTGGAWRDAMIVSPLRSIRSTTPPVR